MAITDFRNVLQAYQCDNSMALILVLRGVANMKISTENDVKKQFKFTLNSYNMAIETKQDNPRFTQMLAQVNSKMLRQNIKDITRTSEIRRQTNNEISAMINKAYNDRQASSDRIQSKWVDSNWEVENYRAPLVVNKSSCPTAINIISATTWMII